MDPQLSHLMARSRIEDIERQLRDRRWQAAARQALAKEVCRRFLLGIVPTQSPCEVTPAAG